MERLGKIMEQATTTTKFRIYPKFKVENEHKEKQDFLKDLTICGNRAARMLGKNFQFRIDEHNADVVDQLWFYITESLFFKGDPQKGIFLAGNIGTGKTVLMLAFLELMKVHTGTRYTVTFPDRIHQQVTIKGIDYYKQRPLLIDDICREPDKVPGWWGENPVKTLLQLRNRHPAQNFATANFKIFDNGKIHPDNEIFKRYGAMIFDRIKENYNFLELTGKSRRK